MPMQLLPDAPGDYRNARYFITASDIAYLPEEQGSPLFKEKLGLDAHLISVGNTQVYVGKDDANVVVAFRGSESPITSDGFKDWFLTNANNFLILPEGRMGTDFAAAGVGARFHRGFLTALADVWDPMFKAVNEAMDEKDRLLWVTGHSLGGALALMATWRFSRQMLEVHQVYTFGGPMIGNEAAAKAYEKVFPNKIFRYIDECDIVPRLPTISLLANDYFHCVSEVLLAAAAGAATAAAALTEAASGDTALSSGTIDRIWGKLTSGIDAHLTKSYLARIEGKCKDLA
jgi:hypothetical protein